MTGARVKWIGSWAMETVFLVVRQGATLLARPPRAATVAADLMAVFGGGGGPAGEAPPLLPHFRLVLRDDAQESPGGPAGALSPPCLWHPHMHT